ncbi:hypothetical protein [Tumebacillus permanentifrigoris]|uniref:Uncharacterized protein n=1 Tax=Tumebacillus permanentifrigoris TaxID=378543 RepID=A0A316DT49_9BACL|nr:hypothetical protein [Tumebacillus permanentifrigoris]PWK10189.1 hypothetical protein C7459_11210 [Tumebacillus permanentifrigoris]
MNPLDWIGLTALVMALAGIGTLQRTGKLHVAAGMWSDDTDRD